jgi:hypothetical protein
MGIEWSILPRGDVAPHVSGVYVTINKLGSIAMNRVTFKRMGEPAAFLVMFDRVNNRIGLKPTGATMKNAYPARRYGRRGGRVVRAFRLLTEFGVAIKETVEFKDAEIDPDGQLILELRTARVSARAHSQCRKTSLTANYANGRE